MEKIIFELSVADANVTVELQRMREALKQINLELKNAKDPETFARLAVEAQQTKAAIADLTTAQKALKREFDSTRVPTDSLAGLRLEYSKLIEQISRLSKAERETKAGQELVKNAAAVKDEINEIQESVGNFTGSVGNYKQGILAAFDVLQQFGGSLGQQAGLLNAARQGFDVVSQGAERFANIISGGIDKLRTGVAGVRDYLTSLRESKKVQDEAAESAEAVGEAIGEAAVEGVQAGAGLAETAKGASLLSRAGGALKGVLASLGIGLIILAITTLIAIFKQFAPVVDFVEQVVAGLSAAFDVLVSRATKVFSAIGKFFTGDFEGAFNDVSDAVSGLGEALLNAATAAAQLQKEFQDLEDAQKDFVLQNARAEAAVARLNVALKDRTKSDRDRLGIAAEITKIETNNLATKIALIDKELDIEKRRLLLTGQIRQEEADRIAAGDFVLARQLEDEFRLKQDQTDRIRDLLVKRVNAEGESATLLERVENRKNAILDAAAQRREAAAKKAQEAIEKENRALEAQAARIRELAKGIRDLDATTILNDFDRQATEIENKRADALEKLATQRADLKKKIQEAGGVITIQDQQEIALIDEQTASIIAAYQQQLDAVTRAREAARDKQQDELKALSLEVQKLADENASKLAEIEAEIINTDFSRQQSELKAVLEERQRALNEQLLAGSITQKQFQEQSIRAQESFNLESAELERERADASVRLAEELRKVKVATARATLNAELDAIRQARDADIKALQERAQKEGVDVTAQITEREIQAAETRTRAYLDYEKAVKDASEGITDAQIAGLEAVNAADQQIFEDKMARLEEEKKRRQEAQDFLLSTAETISGAVLEIEKNRLQQQTDAALAGLDAEYERRKKAAQGNQTQLEKLDKEYLKKKEAIEKAAARERKQIAIKEAVIQGALAVIKALPNLFLAAAAAIATAAQIAVINSQTFAQGGAVKLRKSGTFGGRPHSAGGTTGVFSDGTRVEVEKDEDFIILNKRASAERRKWSELNSRFGGRKFDTGGVLDFTPQIALPGPSGNEPGQIVIVTQAVMSDEQMTQFAGMVSSQTAVATKQAVGEGLDDANRLSERQESLTQNRQA